MSKNIKAALWAVNMAAPVASMKDWAGIVADQAARAENAGANLLVMPEYACMQWLHFAPPDLADKDEPLWFARRARRAFTLCNRIAMDTGIAIMSGTFPRRLPGKWIRIVNRAWIVDGYGANSFQDKVHLTEAERQPGDWMLRSGKRQRAFR